jgi:hypothetical protein
VAHIDGSIHLQANPEKVWPFLVEPEKLLQWLTEMHRFEWLDQGPIGVGSHYYVDKEIRGQVRRCGSVVTRWEENHCFGYVSEAPGFSRLEGTWTIVPEQEGCCFRLEEQIQVQDVSPIIDRLFIHRISSRAARAFLAQLRQVVER